MTETKLTEIHCGSCGVLHAIPTVMYEAALEEGGFWHCPNGHSRGWREGRRAKEEIRRERDLLKQRLAQKDDEIAAAARSLEEERRRSAAYRGEATKVRNRAKAGVCPCCNRTFQNVARHMGTKHPDFDPKVISIDAKRTA